MDHDLRLPEGGQDILPNKLSRRLKLENTVAGTLESSGYKRVETPLLEYLDGFVSDRGGIENTDIIKTFDAAGNVLALRPDCTIPIARMYETEFKDSVLPVRLCYTMDVFSNSPRRQFRQAGAELIGQGGIRGDIEMIALAITALKESGMRDFLVEIGQVGFFKGIMQNAGLNEDDTEEIRQYVEEKNMLGIQLLLSRLGGGSELADKLMQLPILFGGQEVFDKARRLSDDPLSAASLDELETIYNVLCDMGFSEYISIDLGMVHKINYYTGVIFKGMSGYLGQPLLSGGRYDNLLDTPATGFAVNIDQLQLALERQGDDAKIAVQPVFVLYDDKSIAKAYAKANELKQAGETVIMVHDENALFDMREAHRPKRIIKISEKGGEEIG